MSCSTNKKVFDDKKAAKARAKEINEENIKKVDDTRLRAYFCRECEKYHLSSMTKNEFDKIDPVKRAEKRTARIVRMEAEYWTSKLGIDYEI